jgi:hypothetical protein
VTWQIAALVGGGAVFGVALLAFTWWSMSSLRDAQGKVAAERVKTDALRGDNDVLKRLLQKTELERNNALADVAHQKRIAATHEAAANVALEQLDEAKAAELKEKIDAIRTGTLADADAAFDDFVRP